MSKKYLLQLMLTTGIGPVAIKKILKYVALHSDKSLEMICDDPNCLINIIKCNQNTIKNVSEQRDNAHGLYEELCNKGISIITETDADYPDSLRVVLGKDCPPVLFLKGNKELLYNMSVGFCGSRKVSQKGITITEQCAEELIKKQITVVSGYAAGTDLAAHKSAMQNGGDTIFVLAEGILNFSNKQMIRQHLNDNNHLFVSQFLPYSKWNAGNAMKRNSLIIGLSKAMILVEAGKTGGTFAAGNEALQLGQPLFVIDYAKPEVSAEANPYFIDRGGKPIRSRDGRPNLEKVFASLNEKKEIVEQIAFDFSAKKGSTNSIGINI